MREYAKIAPGFWIGDTGRSIKKAGRDAQIVAVYLLTCPSSNMIGLYYLPLPTLMHEVGIDQEGALKALRSLSEALFAHYDPSSEQVFVPEMASYQIGEPLSEKDNRVKWIISEWHAMRKSPFYKHFYERYRESFHLPEPLQTRSPFEAPSKPLRSQEQEQEQEQEKEKRGVAASPPVPPKTPDGKLFREETPAKKKAQEDKPPSPHSQAIAIFTDAWKEKYGVDYPFKGGRDAKAISEILKFLKSDLPKFRVTVANYLASTDGFHEKDRHSIGMLQSQLQRFIPTTPPPAQKPGVVVFDY